MVISCNTEQKRTSLLPYLKPCSPAPGISQRITNAKTSGCEEVRFDPFGQSAKLSKWAKRGFVIGFGIVHTLTIGAAVAIGRYERLVSLPSAALEQTKAETVEQRLWSYLGSSAFEQDRLVGQEKRMQQLRLAAEQERLHAQQLRINAEEKAEGLVTDAAKRAREMRIEAMAGADRVRLETTLIGAEQVLYAEAGDEVTLKFNARIQCQEGEFGETAIATPVDLSISRREIRNLSTCHPNPNTAAGKPIGQVGEWGVAFFKLD